MSAGNSEVLTGIEDVEATDDQLATVMLAYQAAALFIGATAFTYVGRGVVKLCKERLRFSSRQEANETLVPSPPPLVRQSQLDDDIQQSKPFSRSVEVINLITPPSNPPSGSREAARRQHSPASSTPACFKPSKVLDRTPAVKDNVPRRLIQMFSDLTSLTPLPARRPRSQPQPIDCDVRAPSHAEPAQGWDMALLANTAQHEAAICSLDGLKQSKEFQTYIREKHGNLDRHMEQAESKMSIYKMLRSIDRDGFLHAFTRTDIQDFDSHPPHPIICLLDHTISCAVWFHLARLLLAGQQGAGTLLILWLLAHMLLAWPARHLTLLGRLMSVHVVQEDQRYPEHLLLAPVWRAAAAALVDVALVVITMGGAWLLSAILICTLCTRQTVGQLLLNVRWVREVSLGRVVVPQYAVPVSPPKVQRAGQALLAARTPAPAVTRTPSSQFVTPSSRAGQAFSPSRAPIPSSPISLMGPSSRLPASMTRRTPTQGIGAGGRQTGWMFGSNTDVLSQSQIEKAGRNEASPLFTIDQNVWSSPSLRSSD